MVHRAFAPEHPRLSGEVGVRGEDRALDAPDVLEAGVVRHLHDHPGGAVRPRPHEPGPADHVPGPDAVGEHWPVRPEESRGGERADGGGGAEQGAAVDPKGAHARGVVHPGGRNAVP
ncbi:hypothetical protein GCM10023320_22880 [Pseudonocardia adelaidensis]|uniref:Uncharacterized protein n=1 Tax=Pseudonocardia adelaidensis TaxID=648754 RepID=A0ABP9NGI9_9PSEU